MEQIEVVQTFLGTQPGRSAADPYLSFAAGDGWAADGHGGPVIEVISNGPLTLPWAWPQR